MTTLAPEAPPTARTGMTRVGIGLLVGTVAWSTPFTAATAVLLPARIAEIAPDDKVRLLAVLTAVAALVALPSNVLLGALSDRTRSRFGSRTPWVVGGAAAVALLMVPLSHADSYLSILGWWCLVVACLNGPTAALNAVLPDRVPVSRRATVSALVGLGILLGAAIGSVLGAVFLGNPARGFQVVGVLSVILAVASVLIAPDHPTPPQTDAARRRPGAADLAAMFALPRQAPDFYWALAGRLALVLGYFMINGYQLYILTDHVGLSDERAARVLGTNALLFLGAAILGTVAAGPLSDRLQRRKAFVIGASLLSMVAVSFPLFSATTGAMYAFAVVGGVAFGAYFSVDSALMSEVLPSGDARARDLAVLNTANTGGQALAPAASSLLVALGLGFGPVFIGSLVVCALGAALIIPIRSVR
jgi:MFS family permease